MSLFELTISPDYVPSWGSWEVARELIQNCLDGDQAGFPSRITYTTSCILHLHNVGAELKPEHLVLGVTSKAGNEYRGKFGDGLKVALAVACRHSREKGETSPPIKIKTGNQIWTPRIAKSQKFGTDLLQIETSTGTHNNGLTVSIQNVLPSEWALIKSRVLSLNPNYLKIETYQGDILLSKEHKGQLFVKGLWVGKLPDESEYGYDIPSIQLDRDRKAIDTYAVRSGVASILQNAVLANKFKAADLLTVLQNDTCLEARAFLWYGAGSAFTENLLEAWKNDHGDSIPVEGMAEASEISALGRKSRVTSKTICNLLGAFTGTLESIRKSNAYAVKHVYDTTELAEAQTTMVLKSCLLFQEVLGEKVDVTIVDFTNPNIHGVCEKGGKILVSVKDLESHPAFLNTLIHELGHRKGAADLTAAHMEAVTDLTSKVISYLVNQTHI